MTKLSWCLAPISSFPSSYLLMLSRFPIFPLRFVYLRISGSRTPSSSCLYTHTYDSSEVMHDPPQLLGRIVPELDNETANGPKTSMISGL